MQWKAAEPLDVRKEELQCSLLSTHYPILKKKKNGGESQNNGCTTNF